MAVKKDKIRGRELITTSIYEELIKIHVIVNGGDEISIYGNEILSCGDIKVYSIVVVEANSPIRYMGIQ